MELTSAVRSVSYKSDMNKCNGNVGKSNDPESLAGNAKVIFLFSFSTWQQLLNYLNQLNLQ